MVGKKIAGAGLCFLFLMTSGYTHPGELDSNGRHYDNDAGGYHYHRNGKIIWEKKKTKKSKIDIQNKSSEDKQMKPDIRKKDGQKLSNEEK
jgi:hypothetical protein